MKSFTQVSSETASHRTSTFQRARSAAKAADVILFVLASLLIFSLYSTTRATTLPPNYTETQVAGGLASPVAMEFAPDGRLFVSEQAGKVRVIKNGALLATPFVDLTSKVDSTGERGVVGIAFDPNFSANHYVYIYYTAKSPARHNRVSRFTANGDVAVAGSEVAIFELNMRRIRLSETYIRAFQTCPLPQIPAGCLSHSTVNYSQPPHQSKA